MRLLVLVGMLLLVTATPATAHEAPDPGSGIASDARSSVVADTLPPGVTIEVLQNGLALRLHNTTGAPVTVPEAGLRVPPGGSVQWHLDAAHPAGDPPGHRWRVVVEVAGRPYEVLGEVRWTPGPTPWPWLTGAALLAVALAVAARRQGRAAWLAVPLGLAVLCSVGHNGAALAARTAEGSRWGLLGDYLPQAGCWALGVFAMALLVRGKPEGAGLGALATAGLALVTMIQDGAVLGASTVLVVLPAGLDRLLVAGILGLATGVLGALCASRMGASGKK